MIAVSILPVLCGTTVKRSSSEHKMEDQTNNDNLSQEFRMPHHMKLMATSMNQIYQIVDAGIYKKFNPNVDFGTTIEETNNLQTRPKQQKNKTATKKLQFSAKNTANQQIKDHKNN
uniref:Uncharacterized protein n=1 Tax=Solanum tuberosum TaxID=4113 RepID=M1E0H9_SOLTU